MLSERSRVERDDYSIQTTQPINKAGPESILWIPDSRDHFIKVTDNRNLHFKGYKKGQIPLERKIPECLPSLFTKNTWNLGMFYFFPIFKNIYMAIYLLHETFS